MLGTILLIALSGFVIGGLARWAVPGPDPMPIWLTIFFGLAGSAIGGGTTAAVLHVDKDVSSADYFTIELASILVAIVLVVAYRHFVQQRPITGPGAMAPPKRGFGIGSRRRSSFRESVQRAQLLRNVDDLKANGLLTEEEYQEKRARVLRGSDDPPAS